MLFFRLDKIVYFILSILESLIAFRILFKFFGADSSNQIIAWIYDLTGVFVSPFAGIFQDFNLSKFTIDMSAIIALVIYSFAGFILIEFLRLLQVRKEEDDSNE